MSFRRGKQDGAVDERKSRSGFFGMMRRGRLPFWRGGASNREAREEPISHPAPVTQATEAGSSSRHGSRASLESQPTAVSTGGNRQREESFEMYESTAAAYAYLWARQSATRRSSFEPTGDVTMYRPVWSRRHQRRGPWRRMLRRRQRWMLAEYDWHLHEFDRSYLYSSTPHHMRLLEYFDDLTYEEMLALEEHMGKVTRGLTDEEMATLPVELVEEPDETTVEEERSCTICLENFRAGDKVRRLRCQHQFHVLCVDRWLRENKHCPVCKSEIELRKRETSGDMAETESNKAGEQVVAQSRDTDRRSSIEPEPVFIRHLSDSGLLNR